MLSTNAFDYVNVLDKAADASWKRESLISNNIANVDTPGYKRQDLDFQSALKLELSRSNHDSLDSRVGQMDLTKLNPMTFTDMAGYSYRLDGNNVDIETENVALAENQIKYMYLMETINQEFQNLQGVMK